VLLLGDTILGIVVLLESTIHMNVAHASVKSDNAACREKYLPDDPVGYQIYVGGIGTPDPNHSGVRLLNFIPSKPCQQ
jgi:hypothetical protein